MSTGGGASAAAPTVFLHIGTPKSGTTYLQSRMVVNADRARAQGLLWPGPRWGAHVEAARELRLLERGDRPSPAGPWMQLAETARGWSGRAVLVSMEWLASCTPAQVAVAVESLAPCRVEVICTARDLMRSFVAQWQQMTQQRRPWSWDQFVQEMLHRPGPASERFWDQHDIPMILRTWANAVPWQRFHLVTVPPRGADPDVLWTRFCSVLGIDGSDFQQPQRVNESLGVVSAQLMHLVNLVALEQDVSHDFYRSVVRRRLALQVLASRRDSEDQIAMSDEADAWVRRRAEQLVADIGGLAINVVGSLDELRPAERLIGREPSAVNDAELLDVCADAIIELAVNMHERILELRQEAGELRQKIDEMPQRRRAGRRR